MKKRIKTLSVPEPTTPRTRLRVFAPNGELVAQWSTYGAGAVTRLARYAVTVTTSLPVESRCVFDEAELESEAVTLVYRW